MVMVITPIAIAMAMVIGPAIAIVIIIRIIITGIIRPVVIGRIGRRFADIAARASGQPQNCHE